MLKYLIYCWNLLKKEKENFVRYVFTCLLASIIKHILSTQYIFTVYLILKNISNVKYYILGGQVITCLLSFIHSKLTQHIVKKQIFFYQHIVNIQYKYILDRVSNNASYDWIVQNSKQLETQLVLVSNDVLKFITKFHKLIYVISHVGLCVTTLIFINPLTSVINICGLALMTSFLIRRERQSEHIKKSCNTTFITLNNNIRDYSTIMFDALLNGESHDYMSNICNNVRYAAIEQNKGIYFDNDTYQYVNNTVLTLYSLTSFLFMWLFQTSFVDNVAIFLLIRSSFNNLDYFIAIIMEWYVELKQFAINFDKLDDTFKATYFKRVIPKQYDLSNKYVLKLNALQFDYPNFRIKNDMPIKLRYKDRVLVTGASGSGKTTFAKILRNIITPQNINVELVSEKERITLESGFGNISESVCYCPQNDVLFVNGLLKDIIAKNDYDEKKYEQVCELSLIPQHLRQGMIDRTRLSGGELQRVNIAKTLYRILRKNAKIIILDESDSNLGNEHSTKIYDNIFALCEKKMIIVIAHSNNTTSRKDFTKELNIQNGIISFKELRTNQ